MLSPELAGAFFDELEKIAIATTRLRVAQTRSGRRPMKVSTLLKKEKEGTLYKHTKVAQAAVYPSNIPFLEGVRDRGSAYKKKNRGDLPSREDPEAVKREDGRGNAATVYSQTLFTQGVEGGERLQ